MAKKKSADFQKVKLKPGKKLAKGTNVTNTSFKSKKIVIPANLQHKGKDKTPEQKIKGLLSNIGHTSANTRMIALNELCSFINKHKDLVHLNLVDVLNKVCNSITDVEHNVRTIGIDAMGCILKSSSEMQIASFMPMLSTVLSVAMTHLTSKVREDSLEFLKVMLATHPDLICRSATILKNLLEMISQIHYDRSNRNTRKRSLTVACNDNIDSRNWRTKVLNTMNLFLKAVMRNISRSKSYSGEDQEIYWDAHNPLYLTLYARGGLKPVDIEDSKYWGIQSEVEGNYGPDFAKEFFVEIIPLLSDIFTEEVSGHSSSDDDMMPVDTVRNLNMIFQVLSRLGEWVQHLEKTDNSVVKHFLKLYCENFSNKIMKRFPFQMKASKAENTKHCLQLNLAVCFLYSAFLLSSESHGDDFKEIICNYLKSVKRQKYEIQYDSIPVMIKVTQYFLELEPPDTDFISSIILSFCSLLKIADESPYIQELISYLTNVSLQPEYHILERSNCLYGLLHWHLEELWKMPEKKIDKNLLKNIKTFANRKYPHFLEDLNSVEDNVFIEALNYENEDYQDTVINVLLLKPNISSCLLQTINILIGSKTLSQRIALRFIRLLRIRIETTTTTVKDYVHFAEFLLNVAIDTANIKNEEWLEYNLPEFKELWEPCNDIAAFNIIPSLYWKEHEPLFEEASSALELIPSKVTSKVTVSLIRDIMEALQENVRHIPIHSAVSILRLKKSTDDRYFECLMQDLNYACLLFLSVFTLIEDDEWFEANVVELMKSLDLSRKLACDIIMQFEYDAKALKKDIIIFYLLRICKFLISRKVMLPSDKEKMLPILEEFQNGCETSLKEQPLWVKIVNFFSGFYC